MVTQVALVNGASTPLEQATLTITDAGVARGDGAFETIGVWAGAPFRLDDHLRRLDRSLAAIGLPSAPADAIRDDAEAALAGQNGDGALRVFVTGSGTRIVALVDPPVRATLEHLISQPAPWIRPLGTYGPAAAKTMSYGPNMAASRAAQRAGGDDALLLSLERLVLEGPTFAVLWVRDGELVAPALDLGLVDSISRRSVIDLAVSRGITCHIGDYRIEDVLAADEVFTCSAVRPVHPLARLDDHVFPPAAPVTARLAAALDGWRRRTAAAP
jgi:branched-subunit amino acid aminotransferase/4-amino-4-deoxychorismate lyase